MDQKMPRTTSGSLKIFGWSPTFGIGLTKILKSRPVFEECAVVNHVRKSRRKLLSGNVVLLAKL
jgi:hypothetical protein